MIKPSKPRPAPVAASRGWSERGVVRAARALWAPAACAVAGAVLVWSLMVEPPPPPEQPPPAPRALDARARADLEARLWGYLLHARYGEVDGAEKDLGLHPDAAEDARSGRAFAPLVARFDDALAIAVADVKADSARVHLRLSGDRVADGAVYYDLRGGKAVVRDFKYGTARRLDRAGWAHLVASAAAETAAAEDERAAAAAAATAGAGGPGGLPAPSGRALLVVRLLAAAAAGAGFLAVARKLRVRRAEARSARTAATRAAAPARVSSRPKFKTVIPIPTRSWPAASTRCPAPRG